MTASRSERNRRLKYQNPEKAQTRAERCVSSRNLSTNGTRGSTQTGSQVSILAGQKRALPHEEQKEHDAFSPHTDRMELIFIFSGPAVPEDQDHRDLCRPKTQNRPALLGGVALARLRGQITKRKAASFSDSERDCITERRRPKSADGKRKSSSNCATRKLKLKLCIRFLDFAASRKPRKPRHGL